jgi:cell division protein FtsW
VTDRFVIERVGTRRGDPFLVALILVVLGIGLASLFSASFHWAQQLYGDPFRLVRRQSIWVCIGIVAALIISRIPLKSIRPALPYSLALALGLMVLTFVPGMGEEYMGARRWIVLFGQSFQPSELVKLVLVLYLAHILSRKQDTLSDTVNSVLPPLIVVGAFAGLIYIQNDFSTAAFVLVVSLLMFFVAGVRLRFFLSLALVGVPLATILLLTRQHRVLRLVAFLNPELDRFGAGYQVLAAEEALSNGGMWGAGIGQSVQKFGALPEPHSDFVFAIFGEELGFAGVIGIMALFVALGVRGYMLAFRSRDQFNSLLAFGATSMLLLQALLNMAVVCGLVPATGIPLPFFSHGGSAVLISLMMVGLLMNVAREEATAGDRGVVND